MDIHQKALLARLVAQAHTASPSPSGTGKPLTADQLARALTPELRIRGLTVQNHVPFGPVATADLLGKLSHKTDLHIAKLMALLQSVHRTAPPQVTNPTTRPEAIAVLRTLLQEVVAQKPMLNPPHITLLNHQTLHPPRLAAGRAANPKNALASAVNMSVAALYLDNKIGINRLLQILDYLIKKQSIDPRQRSLQSNFMPGMLTPHSPSMFPFHALLNKRRRRRAKAKKRNR